MKLLFDQNLGYKLCIALADEFPKSNQVKLLGLDRADDMTVWRRAAADGYVLVTHDSDFRDISALHGAPPKVVWLRCGNQATSFIADLLREHALRLLVLADMQDIDVLEIG